MEEERSELCSIFIHLGNHFFNSQSFKRIKPYFFRFRSYRLFSSKENIFRFAQTDRSNVKVILVGMEPYPSTYEKDGRYFQ